MALSSKFRRKGTTPARSAPRKFRPPVAKKEKVEESCSLEHRTKKSSSTVVSELNSALNEKGMARGLLGLDLAKGSEYDVCLALATKASQDQRVYMPIYARAARLLVERSAAFVDGFDFVLRHLCACDSDGVCAIDGWDRASIERLGNFFVDLIVSDSVPLEVLDCVKVPVLTPGQSRLVICLADGLRSSYEGGLAAVVEKLRDRSELNAVLDAFIGEPEGIASEFWADAGFPELVNRAVGQRTALW